MIAASRPSLKLQRENGKEPKSPITKSSRFRAQTQKILSRNQVLTSESSPRLELFLPAGNCAGAGTRDGGEDLWRKD
ncbi:hypothetical protein MRB53_028046 [Persea americana]|uniref:Uncharacterized protein n=1 Tax=Persea americana TaxID=3435 RepID=A0ACC2KEX0_PERAE|nr:hypothetical protein MRB53_028046 [Persea americana]